MRDRVKTIHVDACEHCPSRNPPDPECKDIKTWPRAEQIETVFRCAWRPSKACKGYCDFLGITERDLE